MAMAVNSQIVPLINVKYIENYLVLAKNISSSIPLASGSVLLIQYVKNANYIIKKRVHTIMICVIMSIYFCVYECLRIFCFINVLLYSPD